jgi:hypothetical protein
MAHVPGGQEQDQFSPGARLLSAPESRHSDRHMRQLGVRGLSRWQLVQMTMASRVVPSGNYGQRTSSHSALRCSMGVTFGMRSRAVSVRQYIGGVSGQRPPGHALLWFFVAYFDTRLTIEHLEGSHNITADQLSRNNMQSFYIISSMCTPRTSKTLKTACHCGEKCVADGLAGQVATLLMVHFSL